MNCANHPDRERAAFCQNCGKPICSECMRTVGTSVFCEPCLAARIAGVAPPFPGTGSYGVPGQVAPGEPNPGLAALLGFIPGVGAMYNEQYGKGIVHLIVFAILVTLASDVNGVFGLFIAGWIFYQVIEAHHTARARRDGTPLPNPFGLNDISERFGFGKAWPNSAASSMPNPNAAARPGEDQTIPPAGPYAPPYSYTYVPPVSHWGAPQEAPGYTPPIPPVPPVPPVPPFSSIPPMHFSASADVPYARRFPSGAIWLIGLGVLFLFGNSGFFHFFHARLFGPLLLIAIGVWIFVHRMTVGGQSLENDGTSVYQWRFAHAVRSSIWVVLTGILWLLDSFRILPWSRSWPLYLIGGGVLLFFNRAMYTSYGSGGFPSGADPYTPQPSPGSGSGLAPVAHVTPQDDRKEDHRG